MSTLTQTRDGLIGWFAGNPVTANLLMAFFIVGGWMIAASLNAEAFPEIEPNQITVSVAYPGATPEEVEDAITKRVEDVVTGIEGVERVRSTASEGSGTVTLELKDFVDRETVKDDVESAVDQIADFPPAEAEEVSIAIAEPASVVMQLAVFGDLDELALRRSAEALEAALLDADGISLVSIDGARALEISIEVSEQALREYELTLQQVANAVRAGSVNLSAGTLRTSGGDILLRTDQERLEGEAFADIVVSSDIQGRTILLGDIATIVDGFEDGELINLYRSQPALFLSVGASDDQDAFDVSAAVSAVLDGYSPAPGVGIEVVSDSTTVIQDRLNLLIRNALIGLALVFVLLAFTLDLRLAFWTSLGIPISFLGAFWIIGQFTSLNMMTLFGLIVVLGVVVDDAVVVGENIYEEQQRSATGHAGAVSGVFGVLAPVTIGVLTTMAAFAPLLFSTGTLGQILYPVPVVVIAVLLISLIEAFFVLPAHLAHGGEWSMGAMKRMKTGCQAALFAFRDRIVLPLVELAIRARYVTVALCIAFLMVMIGLVREGVVRFVFFPAIEGDTVSVTVEMAPGTPFAATEVVMNRIAAAAEEAVGGPSAEVLAGLSVTIGGVPGAGFGRPGADGGTRIGSELGQATITLVPSAERTLSSAEVERRWRDALGPIAGAESVSFVSSMVDGGADIGIDLSHRDEAELARAVDALATALSAIEGVEEVETGLDAGKRQIEFTLTPEGAAAGLTTQDIARQIRQAFFGEEVQRIQRGREEVRVYVRLPSSQRTSLASLEDFRVRLSDGTDIPLTTVADLTETVSPTAITRVDGRQRISVEASANESVTTPNAVMAILENEILPAMVADDPRLTFSFEGQARDQAEDLASLAANMLVGLGLIYVLLASVLRSYVQPLIIMAAIPFAAGCAILGHLLMGYDVSFLSLFGIVALSGVVINDSVVLIDYFNKLRSAGTLNVHDAAMAAVKRRFRPILLTTLTTFLGLSPMLAETSLQAQFLIPMAISLGYGILFASFVILALVPSLLMITHDVGHAMQRWLSGARRPEFAE